MEVDADFSYCRKNKRKNYFAVNSKIDTAYFFNPFVGNLQHMPYKYVMFWASNQHHIICQYFLRDFWACVVELSFCSDVNLPNYAQIC